jgi:hypothetical protein
VTDSAEQKLSYIYFEDDGTMSQLLLQVLIVVAFGALCFGCGYLTAFIVTRNQWRDEMIKRGVARYNWQTGRWEWGEPPSRPY